MRLITFGRLGLEGGALTRQKPLLLLAYLAVEGAKPRRHLAELFFSETSDPLNSLSRALSNLRNAAPGLIESDNTRVWAANETVDRGDATAFMRHADEGDSEACERLYGGPFAADLNIPLSAELEEWLLGTREYFAGRQRDLLLRLAEQRAAQGKLAKAASYAERAYSLSGAPELEPEHFGRVYGLLALGNSPRAAEVREEAEAFGVEMNVEIGELRAKAQATEIEPSKHNLPLPKSSFVGREPELLEIAKQLAHPECRLLTLHGAGGAGKSRLAVQAAYEAVKAGGFNDGIYFVPLDALTSADLISPSIAEASNLSLQGQEDTLTQVIRHLGDKHILLILDNYEHLMEGATLPAKLLESCPNLKILVTSRERLILEEEWVLTLGGLAVPKGEVGGLEQAQHYDALSLFIQRAKRTKLDFTLTDEGLPHALKICELVEGFPLGIELAAVWVKMLPLAEIAGEIERNVDILSGSSRNTPERHQSMQAVFEHSWKLLNFVERNVLLSLSIFRGSFSRSAAVVVSDTTLPVLAKLVDKALLQCLHNGRYYQNAVLAKQVLTKLRQAPTDLLNVQYKHCIYYIELTRQLERTEVLNSSSSLAVLNEDMPNIRAAWDLAINRGEIEFIRYPKALLIFYERQAKYTEGVCFFNQAIESLDVNNPLHQDTLGSLNICKARLLHRLGKNGEAEKLVIETTDPLEATSSSDVCMLGFNTLGAIYFARANFVMAKEFYDKALQIAWALEDSNMQAAILGNLSRIEQNFGNYAQAEDMQFKVLNIHKGLGNDFGESVAYLNFGELYFDLGDWDKSLFHLNKSLYIAERIHYDMLIPQILTALSATLFEKGSYKQVISLSKKATQIAEGQQDWLIEALSLGLMARALVRLRKRTEARETFKKSLRILAENKDFTSALQVLFYATDLLIQENKTVEACSVLEEIFCNSLTEGYIANQAKGIYITLGGKAREGSGQIIKDDVGLLNRLGASLGIEAKYPMTSYI